MSDSKTIPEGWVETTLGEVVDYVVDNRGKTPPTTESGYELLEVNTISKSARGPDYSKVTKFIDENTFKTWFRKGTIKVGDILIPTVGTIGNVSYSKQDRGAIAQNLIALRINQENYSLYFYYLLSNPLSKRNLLNLDIGGVQPSIKVPHLLNMIVMVPSFPEQQAIAQILSSFDDKIELLREQNEMLEKIAQTIFQEWFGKYGVEDELPKGWRVGKIGTEFDITIGRTPPRIEPEWFSKIPTGKKWISIKDIGNSKTYIFETSEYLTDAAIKKFNIPVIPVNTTILSFKMTVGKLTITTEEMLSNEAIAHIKIRDNSVLSTEFIYCYLQRLDFNSLGSTSSIVTAINSSMIKEIEVLVPSIEKVKEFNKQVRPVFQKIHNNLSQIELLSKTRDELLPRLMSGEVRVEV